MKKILVAMFLLGTVSLAACTAQPASIQSPTFIPTATSDAGAESEVRGLVENFGQRLKLVSLLAPSAAQDLQKQYAEFVSPSLLAAWTSDISKAPGRMVSSPWPDRIEIAALAKEGSDRYVVTGSIIEVTSVEVVNGGAAERIPVRVVVQKDQGRWVITEYTEER